MPKIMSNQENFYQNYFQYFRGIDLCIENKLPLPALSLIYSGIDTFAWLAYGDINTKDRFVRWVECYMYKAKKLRPKPIDLYAARCAILHTLTPDSKLSKEKKAVQLTYAWGNADVEKLERCIDVLAPEEITCVHLNDLLESFRHGVADFLELAHDIPECADRMSKHYSHKETERIEAFNHLMSTGITNHQSRDE